MQPSLPGLLVCAALMVVAYYLKGTLIIGLVASLAFGATAALTLTSLGGSSPLIYTIFACLLVIAVAARRRIWLDLGDAFGSIRPIWIVASLMAYAIMGAWLFPRLFSGQTTVFVVAAGELGVTETSLAPVSGNISQTGYFILGGLTMIALCALLLHSSRITQLRRAFFVWCVLLAGMGLIDFIGKNTGAGDILAPIRTANYAIITGAVEAGFTRITGAFSEASSFGSVSVACLAFSYTYWRKTGSHLAQGLAAILLLLTMLSTSSTAYVTLAFLCLPVGFSIIIAVFRGQAGQDELVITIVVIITAVAILGMTLFNAGIFDPVLRLLESTILNKADSSSGQERTYWNLKSLQAFVDTGGLGIGLGSSRASSWPIAVLSQLGLFGSLMMLVLLAVIVRGLGSLNIWIDSETDAVVAGIRNAALASIIAASLAGGNADPGILFFIALAVISATRVRARQNMRAFQLATRPDGFNAVRGKTRQAQS